MTHVKSNTHLWKVSMWIESSYNIPCTIRQELHLWSRIYFQSLTMVDFLHTKTLRTTLMRIPSIIHISHGALPATPNSTKLHRQAHASSEEFLRR